MNWKQKQEAFDKIAGVVGEEVAMEGLMQMALSTREQEEAEYCRLMEAYSQTPEYWREVLIYKKEVSKR